MTGSAVGGLSSWKNNSRISKSFSIGDVESNGTQIGGFVGLISDNELNNLPTIENSYSLGNVYSEDIEAASFVGVNIDSTITKSYSLGYTYAKIDENGVSTSAAGFVNSISNRNAADRAKVESSFFLSQGLNAFSTSNSQNYPDKDSLVIELTGMGYNDFNNIPNFTAWNFTTVWMMDPILKRPVLRSNLEDARAYTEIKSASDLSNIRNNLKGYFVLTTILTYPPIVHSRPLAMQLRTEGHTSMHLEEDLTELRTK